jgi:predicted GNAT family N-acyltransferase
MNLIITQVSYKEAIESLQCIRGEVFQREQGVAEELEFDGLDETAVHLLAYLDGIAVGTLRIRQLSPETAKIERLAVVKTARGRGIGRQLMEKAIALVLLDPEKQEIVINAQEYIQELYKKLGFEAISDRFYEAGIPHIKMCKRWL